MAGQVIRIGLHLDMADSVRSFDGFLQALYTEEIFTQWRALRAKGRFSSERQMVEWILDEGLAQLHARLLPDHNYAEAASLPDHNYAQSTEQVEEPMADENLQEEALRVSNAILLTLYGKDLYTRWRIFKQKLNVTREMDCIKLVLSHLQTWNPQPDHEDNCEENSEFIGNGTGVNKDDIQYVDNGAIAEKVQVCISKETPYERKLKLCCKFCNYTCFYRLTLREHVSAKHTGDEHYYECDQCGLRLASRKQLNNHRRHRHYPNRSRAFKCDRCDFRGKTEAAIKQHIHWEHKERPLKCDQCGFGAPTRAKLSYHRANLRSIKCDRCDHKAGSCNRLRKHKVVEHPETRPSCNFCGHTELSMRKLKQHRRREHRNVHRLGDCYVCKLCQFKSAVTAAADMYNHNCASHTAVRREGAKGDRNAASRRTNTGHTCKFCDHTEITRVKMRQHRRLVHANVLSSGNNYVCNVCNFRAPVTAAADMYNHNCASPALVPLLVPPPSLPTSTPVPHPVQGSTQQRDKEASCPKVRKRKVGKNPEIRHTCKFCGHTEMTREKLRQHRQIEHSDVLRWGSSYVCKGCKLKTKVAAEMYNHNCAHYHFTCHQCAFTSDDKALSDEHRKMHPVEAKKRNVPVSITVTGKYACEVCGFRTNTRKILDSHVRKSHVVAASYACDKCEFLTTGHYLLQRHKKKCREREEAAVPDKIEAFRCKECQFLTDSEPAMEAHRTSAHGGVAAKTIHRCGVCNYTVASFAHIRLHEKLSHGIGRTWQCVTCGLEVNSRGRLLQHRRDIHGVNKKRTIHTNKHPA